MEQVGRYQIEGELGRGAMGVVFRALDPAIGRTVAIKTIQLAEFTDSAEHERLRERLLNEARSAGILSHPGIVTVYDVGEQDDLAYIAMEFVNGSSLEQILSSGQPPDKEMILRVLRETAVALDYAHKKGIVHRDIKPANIMLHEDGTIKITDFGVAKISASQQLTHAGTMLGTPNYMSPEQVQGKAVDGRSDEFSLAVIAYEMLTGEKPFSAEQLPTLVYKIVHEKPAPPHLLNPTLAWQVEVVLRKALEKEPGKRYPTCVEFVNALEGACKSSKNWKPLPRGGSQSMPTVVTEAAEPALPLREKRRREREPGGRRSRKALVLTVLGIVALLAAAGAYVVWLRIPKPPPPQALVEWQPPKPPPELSGRPSPAGPAAGTQESSQGVVLPPPEPPPEETVAQPPVPAAVQQETSVKPLPKPEASAPAKETPQPSTPQPSTPQQPGPPAESTVLIRTSPPGATVVFDDNSQMVCRTPCSLSLPEGRHTASAVLAGHRSALRIFRVPRDLDLFLYLAKMTGQVQILSTPPGATLEINGAKREEKTPVTLDLPVGKYTVAVSKDGYKRDQQAIEVKDNAFLRLDFTLGK